MGKRKEVGKMDTYIYIQRMERASRHLGTVVPKGRLKGAEAGKSSTW